MSSVPPKTPGDKAVLRFWWVRDGEQTLGPYTGKQMLTFLLTGRIRPATLVRPEQEPDWRPASEDSEFARYFAGPVPAGVPVSGASGEARRRMPNFVIVVEGGSVPIERVEAVIGELGPSYRLTRDVWLLQCALQPEKIRTYLARQLASIERLFIADVKTGTYASHKFHEGLEDEILRLLEQDQ